MIIPLNPSKNLKLPAKTLWPLLGILALHFLWILSQTLKLGIPPLIGQLIYDVATLSAALTCWWVAGQQEASLKRAWVFVALGISSFSLGDWTWLVFEQILFIDPFPSLADVFYVLSPLLLVIAFSQFPRSRLQRVQRWQLILDVAISVIATTVFLWPFQYVPILKAYGEPSLALWLSLAYPSIDLVLLALFLSIILHQPEQSLSKDKAVLAVGLSLVIIADLSYAVLTGTDSYYSGHFIDIFWTAGYGLLAIAGYLSFKSSSASWPWLDRLRQRGLTSYIPYLAAFLTLAFVLILQSRPALALDKLVVAGLNLGSALVTLFVIIRQIFAIHENQQLNSNLKKLSEDLELRVQDRTRELEDSHRRLMSSEKLASLGRLMGGMAHEINTPLAAARNYLLQPRPWLRNMSIRLVWIVSPRKIIVKSLRNWQLI
ncbi:MAG: hypothetical protein R2865_07985 [Deinococcales bacterium]